MKSSTKRSTSSAGRADGDLTYQYLGGLGPTARVPSVVDVAAATWSLTWNLGPGFEEPSLHESASHAIPSASRSVVCCTIS